MNIDASCESFGYKGADVAVRGDDVDRGAYRISDALYADGVLLRGEIGEKCNALCSGT